MGTTDDAGTTGSAATRPGPARTFQGREVRLPVEVRDASSGSATYLVPAAAARTLLPDDRLEIAEVLPGRALFSLAAIDYRDNDLGDYDEVSMAVFVRPRGERASLPVPWLGNAIDFLRPGSLATYIWKLPVNQSFTCEAGAGIWGFPKSVERIAFTDGGGRRSCRLDMDGRHVLTLDLARAGTRSLPESAMTTYTFIDGRLHRTRFVSRSEGVGFAPGGAGLVLGDHPIARTLRALGLPRRPLLAVWMERQRARFEAPEPV